MSDCECMTIDEIRAMALERNCPGPDVDEHDEDYDGECYCWSCLSYLSDGPCAAHAQVGT